jgi:tetratricopeptide (TPR) repeat protein
MGDESQASIAALNIAEVRSDQGRMDEAEPVFREVLDVRKAAGNPLKIAEAWSLLGRHLARVGEHEEARAVLEEARELFEAEGDAEDLLTTDAWLSECHVLEGNTAAGLELSLETLERAESLSGVSVVVTHLHRTRGWAYMQMAELVNARTALEESLRIARGDNENFGIMSADYEVALTLNALVRLRGLTGEPTEEIAYERDMIFARLGVLSVPEPPLPH